MRGKEDRISKSIRFALWESRPHVCGICKKSIDNFSEMHVDHIIPVSKGGETVPENLQLSHSFCNISKGNRVEDQTDCSESFVNDWFGNRIPQELFDNAKGRIGCIESYFSGKNLVSQLHIAIYISIISSIVDINTIGFLPDIDDDIHCTTDYYYDDFVGYKTFSDILALAPSGYGKTTLLKRLDELVDDVNYLYGRNINKKYTDFLDNKLIDCTSQIIRPGNVFVIEDGVSSKQIDAYYYSDILITNRKIKSNIVVDRTFKKTILKADTQDNYISLFKDDINDGIKNNDLNVLTKQLVLIDDYKYNFLATDDLRDKVNIMSFNKEDFLSEIDKLVYAMNTINRFGLHLLHDYINFTTTDAFCVHAEIVKRFHVFYPFEFIKNDSKLKSKFDSLVVNYASIFAVVTFADSLRFRLDHNEPLYDLRVDYWDFGAANYLVYLSFLNIKKLVDNVRS